MHTSIHTRYINVCLYTCIQIEEIRESTAADERWHSQAARLLFLLLQADNLQSRLCDEVRQSGSTYAGARTTKIH